MRFNGASSNLLDSSSRRYFFVVCTIAFILRLMLFIYITPNAPIKYYANPDAYNYENIALNLVNHRVFSDELQPPYTPDVRRTPMYPMFLAGVYALSGSSKMLAVLCQLLIGSLTVGLTYLFARALLVSYQDALFAALLLAFDPLSIMYTNMLVTETLFTFFLVAGSAALVGFIRSQRLIWLLISAIMYSGVVLARPIGQFLPLVLIPLFVFAASSKQRSEALRKGLLFALVSLGLISVWVFRNHRVAGIWAVSNVGEYTLAYYSARNVLEDAEDLNREEAMAQIDAKISAHGHSENLSLAEVAKRERQVALSIFGQYPLQTIEMYLDSMLQFLINPGLDNICAQLSRAGNVKGCEATKVISNPSLVEKAQLKFGKMDNVQLVVAAWSVFFLFTVYALSSVGIYVLVKNRQWFELLSLGIIIGYLILLSAGGQTTSRFRVPTIPYWSVLASVGFGMLKERFSRGGVSRSGEKSSASEAAS